MKNRSRAVGALGTAMMLVAATAATGQAQQRGMMGGQMHADTAPAARPCPGGMGGTGMMGMMQGRGMGPGMMGGGMGMMDSGSMMGGRGMMGMMGANPSMLLAQRDVLELTEDQVARLEELREKQQSMMQGMHKGMMAVRSQMQDVTGAESPDMGSYRSALEEMADQMVSHHMQMARFREQVMDVLTPEQREKLQTGMRMMRNMMGDRGMGGSMP